MLILLQTLIFFVGILFTGFLLIDGWLTQSVWGKDCSQGWLTNVTKLNAWLNKIQKGKNPDCYWRFMAVYAVLFLIFLILLIL